MLKICDVKKKFLQPNGQILTVTEINELVVEAGQQLAITGPSGSGKTTLLHIIAGLTAPSRGDILWNDINVYSLPERKRDSWRAATVGYVFQNFNLIHSLSVMENILAAVYWSQRSLTPEIRQKAMDLLEQVGLADRAQSKPGRLSMGEQQRVAIVRAVINQPALVLADEPTASLDQQNVRIILDILQQLCVQNNTILLVATHDLEVAARFSERLEMRSTRGQAS